MQFKNTHNLLKNEIILKNRHTNTNNLFTVKFYNKLIYSNIKANDAKQELLGVNLMYSALMRWSNKCGLASSSY